MELIQRLINGILLGGVYAVLGMGMTLMFGIVGVTNLAHGEYVLLGAYASTLAAACLHLDPLLTLVVTVPPMFLLGCLIQYHLVSPAMKQGPDSALLVTFALSIILQDGLLLTMSAHERHASVPYAVDSVRLLGVEVSVLNLVVFGISALTVLVLTLFLAYTHTGRAILAVSDDRQAAMLTGIRERRIYGVAMGVAMVTAAVAGTCVSMKWTFSPSSGGEYLLIAFIVVALGGMGSIPGTLLAGIGFGLAQALGGVRYGLVIGYVFLLSALALRPNKVLEESGQSVLAEGSAAMVGQERERSKTVRLGLGAAFLILLVMGEAGLLSSNAMRWMLRFFLYTALGEAWNLMSGFAGMTSLGQQLYIGLAGYTVAIVVTLQKYPLMVGLAAGAAVSVLAALLLSRVLFRMKGMYFAIATWVAAETMEKLFLNWDYVQQGSGLTLQMAHYPSIREIYRLSLLVCCLSVVLMSAIRRSRLGLALTAMREDTEAAAAIGIPIPRTRLTVLLLSALLTALAGGVLFVNKGTIYPDSGFSAGWTVSAVFICMIGGVGTVAGPVLGAAFYVLLSEHLAHYPGWSNLMLGLITLLVIRSMPDGIVGFVRRCAARGKKRPRGPL